MRERRFGGSDFKSEMHVHFSFEKKFLWVRVEVLVIDVQSIFSPVFYSVQINLLPISYLDMFPPSLT
jgi:hypothetical protein